MNGKEAEWVLYLYAESPVHAGAADSSGVVDLAIQREAGTGYPVVWGQSLKGALRQAARDAGWDEDCIIGVFGSEPPGSGGEENEGARGALKAGALSVGDAQLVALPVPTLRRTFAWVTSDLALARLARKRQSLIGAEGIRPSPPVPAPADDGGLAGQTEWCGTKGPAEVLGPLWVGFGDTVDENVRGWAELVAGEGIGTADGLGSFAKKFTTDLLVVGQDVMPELSRSCTEVTARVQLSEEKTVQHGPFYSEYLPAETVLAASLSMRRDGKSEDGKGWAAFYVEMLVDLLHNRLHQLGGDETLGKGLVWCRLVGPGVAADSGGEAGKEKTA
ncbi:type III-B CRISPR module RAMP protein Cmr4 [Streptomyces calidiresistens]|uniref:Type III-B CRISPR module RAMP protein Cmr4 n=1 Tax=Streptomyces calidiresistens TaxID=1485586 RepID=A0A7W3T0E0_9ACTN|nr:type III-B CRISPR module RAMP protein Cmr4 [Streptomyces calidiresistens]MBB0228326.1 type III-B CRISPR module RAMP protein Cmr4 [Streptomyces calidiresistens]